MKILNTSQASAALGVSVRRVQALIESGRLPARKLGRDWVIDSKNLKLVSERKPGRPRKEE